MKTMTLIASALLLLVSNIAGAQEQPSAGPQEQTAPTAKMTGEDTMGHMGPGMMRHGMKGHGMKGHGMMRHGMNMRVMMILMDTDGDGALSLEEVQAAHAKIFKVIDDDKDGKVTQAEIEMFFRGGSPVSAQ
jgi:EF hand